MRTIAIGNRAKMAKKVKKTRNGKLGGLVGGKSHPEGGVQTVIEDLGNKPLVVERKEVIINAEAVTSPKVRTYTGTNQEILSEINQSEGNGVPIHLPNETNVVQRESQNSRGNSKQSSSSNIRRSVSTSADVREIGRPLKKRRKVLPSVLGNESQAEAGNVKEFLYGGSPSEYFKTNIDDLEYKWRPTVFSAIKNKKTGTRLDKLIIHKELFSKYPLIKQVQVFFGKTEDETIDTDSYVNHSEKNYSFSTIHINLNTTKDGKEKHTLNGEFPEFSKEAILLHEIQHVLQQADRREGYGLGIDTIYQKIIQTRKNIRPSNKGGSKEERELIEKEVNKIYRALPAEQEAMKTVFIWLREKGLQYNTAKNIDWSYESEKQRKEAQGDSYSKGGNVDDSRFYKLEKKMGGGFDDYINEFESKKENKVNTTPNIVQQTMEYGIELINTDYLPKISNIEILQPYLVGYKEMNLYKMGWRFNFGSSRQWAGLCSREPDSAIGKSKEKNIYVSIQVTKHDKNWKENMQDVILHEIAHAILFEIFFFDKKNAGELNRIDDLHAISHGHGLVWKKVVAHIGGSGSIMYSGADYKESFKRYKYDCANCNYTGYGDMPKFTDICDKCGKAVTVQGNIN